MEKTLKFNSQVATSREQSERLLALGLKKETADMCWQTTTLNGEAITYPSQDVWMNGSIITNNHFPAWSLHRLIEMMPKTIGRYFQYTSNDSCGYMDEDALNMNGGFDEGNIYDSIISCIEWLIKKGHFDKEYYESR